MTISSPPNQFDYIIIGAGIGGLTLASRLSEDPTLAVLLIEAGPDARGDPRIDTPGLVSTLYGDPNLDWDFMSEPQTHIQGRQIAQPRGRVLGGSSALNVCLAFYPSQGDFKAWEALGNHGWGGKDMAPYLRKFHTYQAPDSETSTLLGLDEFMDKKNQGDQGPVPVGFPAVYGPFNKAWNEAFAALGWENDQDPILGDKLGAFTCPLTVDAKNGTRGYAAAYYTPDVAARPNLTLWTDTRVQKILTEEDGQQGKVRAIGVSVHSQDESKTVHARHEVILSAGSLQSPQLLELSGIGDSKILKQHDIPVVLDLPGVGENLQDHCIVILSYKVAEGQTSADALRDPQAVQAAMELYQQTKGGPFAGMPISAAYMPLVNQDGAVGKEEIHQLADQYTQQDEQSSPGIQRQTHLLRQSLLNPQEPSAEYNYLPVQYHTGPGRNTMDQIFAKKADGNYISIFAMLSHPFSRGSVHIKSSDIQEKPTFDPNYLSHPIDLEVLARHIQFIDQKLVHTEPFQSLLQPDYRIPDVKGASLADLDQAKRVVQERLFTCFHPAGSCAMMPHDMDGVVDERLKVHGTTNLRVVDASVMPLEPTGNLQTVVYAIAEKAADLIKEDYLNSKV